MLKRWDIQSQTLYGTALNIQDDLKTLAFHILNRAGFGVQLHWHGISDSGKEVLTADEAIELKGAKLKEGHLMSFGEAMLIVVDHLRSFHLPEMAP
jgi:hypothetical protein